MTHLSQRSAGLSEAGRSYGVGAFSVLLGAFFSFRSIVDQDHLIADVFWGVMSGGPLAMVGICAFARPAQLPRVLGAFVVALSAPLFLSLVGMPHPDHESAKFTRGTFNLYFPVIVPFNMLIGAALMDRLCRPWWIGGDTNDTDSFPRPSPSVPLLARAVGVAFAAVGVLTLLLSSVGTSPDPEIARWQFVHYGILPGISILVFGLITAMLPSRLPIMCGVLVGTLPAVMCSSLVVDPGPDISSQVVSSVVAYSLPLTLPFTVGVGGLIGNYVHRKVAN